MVLGGAFFVNGNVNPAAEANIFGDPEAADLVLGLCPRCRVVGLDVTHKAGFLPPHIPGWRVAGGLPALLGGRPGHLAQGRAFFPHTFQDGGFLGLACTAGW